MAASGNEQNNNDPVSDDEGGDKEEKLAKSNTPPKKKKRLSQFKESGKEGRAWLSAAPNNIFVAQCDICNREFNISNAGIGQVQQHEKTSGHKINERARSQRDTLKKFGFVAKNSSDAMKKAAAELVYTYHCIMHNQSYNSLDCCIKLTKSIFTDTGTGPCAAMSCGRTKAEMIAMNVLKPKALETLQTVAKGKLPFSVQTDASNHKTKKMWPVSVQYFDHEGIHNSLVSFTQNANETAGGISGCIMKALEDADLDINNCVAFSADNCSANFGCNNSAYTKLVQENANIKKGNCHAHILHNAISHCTEVLHVEVEEVVLKAYAYFAKSACRVEKMQTCCDDADVQYKDLLRHITTKWLSLLRAIDRLLEVYPILIQYFQSLPMKDLPARIKNLFFLTGVLDEKIEIYLLFTSNLLQIFDTVVKKLEADGISVIGLYETMSSLRKRLQGRLEDKFFGAGARAKLKLLPEETKAATELNFCQTISTAIQYLERWFDFSPNNWLCLLSPLTLTDSSQLTLENVEKVAAVLHVKDISVDDLYEEVKSVAEIIDKLSVDPKWESLSSDSRWKEFFLF